MKKDQKTFLQGIKMIFGDTILLYKNFFHWNISKILISIWSFVLGTMLGLPFFIVALILMSYDPIDWYQIISYLLLGQSIDYDVLGNLLVYPGYVLIETLLIIVGILISVVGYSYSIVLKAYLYLGYTKGEKIPYLRNLYFHRGMILQYMKVFFRILLYLIIPIVALVALFLLLYGFFRTGVVGFETLSIISFIIFVITLLVFIYISYRVSFAYIVLLDKKDIFVFETAKNIVHTSINFTKGKVIFVFLMVSIVYGIIYSPFQIITDSINLKGSDAKIYLAYKTEQLQILTKEAEIEYQALQEQFQGRADSEIIREIIWLGRFKFFMSILTFLVVSGVYQMVLVSFYIHFLKESSKKTSSFLRITQSFFGKKKSK